MQRKLTYLSILAMLASLSGVPILPVSATDVSGDAAEEKILPTIYFDDKVLMQTGSFDFSDGQVIGYFAPQEPIALRGVKYIIVDNVNYSISYVEEHLAEAIIEEKPEWAIHIDRPRTPDTTGYGMHGYLFQFLGRDAVQADGTQSRIVYTLFATHRQGDPEDRIVWYWDKDDFHDCSYNYLQKNYNGACMVISKPDENGKTVTTYTRTYDAESEHNEGYEDWATRFYAMHAKEMDGLDEQIDVWDGNAEEKEQMLKDLRRIKTMSVDTKDPKADSARADELIEKILNKKFSTGDDGDDNSGTGDGNENGGNEDVSGDGSEGGGPGDGLGDGSESSGSGDDGLGDGSGDGGDKTETGDGDGDNKTEIGDGDDDENGQTGDGSDGDENKNGNESGGDEGNQGDNKVEGSDGENENKGTGDEYDNNENGGSSDGKDEDKNETGDDSDKINSGNSDKTGSGNGSSVGLGFSDSFLGNSLENAGLGGVSDTAGEVNQDVTSVVAQVPNISTQLATVLKPSNNVTISALDQSSKEGLDDVSDAEIVGIMNSADDSEKQGVEVPNLNDDRQVAVRKWSIIPILLAILSVTGVGIWLYRRYLHRK